MDFNTRYYLTESVQQVLKSFGNNCILTGLNIKELNINNDNEIYVKLTSGKVICDSVLIEFPTEFDINFNVDLLNNNGFIVIVIGFRYLRTSRMNQSIVSLKYVDENNICSNWFSERDKIILGKIEFNKNNKTVDYIASDYFDSRSVIINNKEYEIRPFNYTIQELRPILKSLQH